MAGFDVYLTKPEGETNKAIIFATDAFGLSLVNNKLLADKFAKHGFLVVMPDLFDGDPVSAEHLQTLEHVPEGWMDTVAHKAKITWMITSVFLPWLYRHPFDALLPRIDNLITELKQNHGVEKIGMAGYCYGGKVSALFGAKPDRIDAFAVAHPSRLSVPDDIEAIKTPCLFCCAEEDQQFAFTSTRQQAEQILIKNKIQAKFVDYLGQKHGFAVRGDSKNAAVANAATDCCNQMASFFKQHLV